MRCGIPKRSISRTWTALRGTATFSHTEALPHVFSILLGQQPSTLSLDYLRAFAASFEPIDDERRGVASGRDLAVPERERLGRSSKVDLFDLEQPSPTAKQAKPRGACLEALRCSDSRTRTLDPAVNSRLLYQLS